MTNHVQNIHEEINSKGNKANINTR